MPLRRGEARRDETRGWVRVRSQGQVEVRVLALVYALGGLLCLASACCPLAPDSPVALFRVLAGVGVVAAAAVLVLGRWWPAVVVHVAFVVFGALVALVAARSVTPVGVVGLGPVLIAASLYAAHSFATTTGRVLVLLLGAAATGGAIASPAGGFTIPWVISLIATLGVFEVHGLLIVRLRAAATTDPLTGVANRRTWDEAAARALRAATSRRTMTVAIIDLDGFKQVNDTLGHAAGDAVLRELTAGWKPLLRSDDLVGRYGGDEFVLSLPGTDQEGAAALVARLRDRHPMAWSVGISSSRDGDSLDVVMARADADLYAQKRSRAFHRRPDPSPAPAPRREEPAGPASCTTCGV